MIPLRQFAVLARMAMQELFRQPACFLIIICTSALTILIPFTVSHQLGQTTHLAVDGALAFQFVSGIVLAGYAACSTLHNECLSGTILVVFSKPVGRLTFFLAKFTAVAALLVFFTLSQSLSTLLAERLAPRNFEFDALGVNLILTTPFLAFIPAALINFFKHRPFVPYALWGFVIILTTWVVILGSVDRDGHHTAFASMMEWQIVPACLLAGIALLIMAAIALSLASRLPTPTTVALLVLVFFTGLIADHLVSLLPTSLTFAALIPFILPDIQAFWLADRLAGHGAITLALIRHAALYAVLYGAGVLCLGYLAFRRRQF